jgi:4-diphosphocytidyl-2C-methyl-D-erythritol kinase
MTLHNEYRQVAANDLEDVAKVIQTVVRLRDAVGLTDAEARELTGTGRTVVRIMKQLRQKGGR